MLVGEIGISRREVLYELQWWEVHRIIRGYRRRGTLERQLLAECAYASMFTMRDPKGKSVSDLFPSLFEKTDDDEDEKQPAVSEEDRHDLMDEMDAINAYLAQEQKPKKKKKVK